MVAQYTHVRRRVSIPRHVEDRYLLIWADAHLGQRIDKRLERNSAAPIYLDRFEDIRQCLCSNGFVRRRSHGVQTGAGGYFTDTVFKFIDGKAFSLAICGRERFGINAAIRKLKKHEFV